MELPSINRTIKKIETEQLFGYYNYKVDQVKKENDSDPLLIIYGDNGSGKTTILRMIFYLLSPLDNSGHKTKLSEIKFRSFSITLNDDTVIKAYRVEGNISGSFTLSVQEPEIELYEVFMELAKDRAIRVSENPELEAKYSIFLDKIKSLNITINFLSDDRKMLSFSENLANPISKRRRLLLNHLPSIDIDVDEFDKDEDESINLSIKRLESWIKSNVLKGAKQGEENANTIYSTLIKQISSPGKNSDVGKQVKTLLEKLRKIRIESLKYNQSGLVSQIEIDDFEAALNATSTPNLTLVFNILEPYIKGIQGRLDSLRPVQNVLSKLLESVNDYFANKTITYTIEKGFIIKHNFTNEHLSFQSLSSGEKQLLNLFSSVITTSESSTIFIIDEPEISLNVKWQRKLIGTLLGFATDKKVQFIFASHSIELLGNHKNFVHKLVNIE